MWRHKGRLSSTHRQHGYFQLLPLKLMVQDAELDIDSTDGDGHVFGAQWELFSTSAMFNKRSDFFISSLCEVGTSAIEIKCFALCLLKYLVFCLGRRPSHSSETWVEIRSEFLHWLEQEVARKLLKLFELFNLRVLPATNEQIRKLIIYAFLRISPKMFINSTWILDCSWHLFSEVCILRIAKNETPIKSNPHFLNEDHFGTGHTTV